MDEPVFFLAWQDHGSDTQWSLPLSIGVDLASTAHQVGKPLAPKSSILNGDRAKT